MKVLTDFKKIDIQKWELLCNTSPFTSPFQTPEYFNFFNSIEGQTAKVFAIEEENKLKALCVVTIQKEKGIKGYFSKRAIIYGGPLVDISDNGKLYLKNLLSVIESTLNKKIIYFEIRNFNDYSYFKDIFKITHWKYIEYLNIQISLKDQSLDGLLSSMKYNRRREIQLSIKQEAFIEEARNIDDVKILYSILLDLYKTRVKLPLPELDFFLNLYNSLIGKIFIVLHKEQIIGGSFCLFYPNKTIYTLYYCGIRDYHTKIFPTHLAIIASIKFGLKNNLTKLDLMGAGKPNQEYGVRKYKSEFGGKLVEHGRYIKINKPIMFALGKLGLKLIKLVK